MDKTNKVEPSKTHLIDIDRLTGDEYIAWGEEMFNENFFVNYWQETDFEQLYKQLEFPDYGKNLCTIYWPITTLSIMMGRELTQDERLQLVKDRSAMYDFDPSIWGWTSIGVDVARRWYNTLYPSDPIRTALVNSPELLHKLAQKKIPITTSLRGNRQFTLDQKDWTMDELNYWEYTWARYGHCRCRKGLEILDNYGYKYRYKNIDDLELCTKMAFESPNVYVFFKESSLSELGRKYLRGMRDGLWNWEKVNDPITRYESSRISLRLNPMLKEKDVWNGKNRNAPASKYEISIMLHNANNLIPIYLGNDRNKNISRGDVVEMIYSV